MRKQYLVYFILVFGIVATAYGGFTLIYHLNHGNGLNVLALVLFILGVIALGLFFTLYIITFFSSKKKKEEPVVQEKEETPVIEEVKERKPEPKPQPKKTEKEEYVSRNNRSSVHESIYDVSTIYIKQVGYGPIMRVNGNRILDMRNNTYYRIEGGLVKQEGYGPQFEIRGNQIKNAFGGYLYELSGSNINKVYGGFYASISGHYITLYDLSIKYEMTGQLSKNQILAVAALLFGKY